MKLENIKFRAKRLDNQEWACGYFYQENDNTYIIADCQKESLLNRNTPYKVDPDTVCQFIGLHDKNGKEIYDGDVLQRTGDAMRDIPNPCDLYSIISYEDYPARFAMQEFYLSATGRKGSITYSHSFTQGYMQNFEIVGSIHDAEWQEKLNPTSSFKVNNNLYKKIMTMENKQRMFYFGTQGCPGHYPMPINFDLSEISRYEWKRLDGALCVWIMLKGTYSQCVFMGSEWSMYAVPWSVDDKRGGCHTSFFWEGEHTKEEMEAYIKHDAFLRRQFRFKLEANMVRKGDIVQSSDDTLVKINHIGPSGEVHYIAYADNARGKLQHGPFTYFYGYITSCHPATEKQKEWLRKWIKEHNG